MGGGADLEGSRDCCMEGASLCKGPGAGVGLAGLRCIQEGASRKEGQRAMGAGGGPASYCTVQGIPSPTSLRGSLFGTPPHCLGVPTVAAPSGLPLPGLGPTAHLYPRAWPSAWYLRGDDC